MPQFLLAVAALLKNGMSIPVNIHTSVVGLPVAYAVLLED